MIIKQQKIQLKKNPVWMDKKDDPGNPDATKLAIKIDVIMTTMWSFLILPLFYSSRVLCSYYERGFFEELHKKDLITVKKDGVLGEGVHHKGKDLH